MLQLLRVAEMIKLLPLDPCTWWALPRVHPVALALGPTTSSGKSIQASLAEQQLVFIWRQQELENPLFPLVAHSSSYPLRNLRMNQ